jgi:Rrf2 family protein
MIRLSTKGRYGTRLMLNLARHYNHAEEVVILKSVSDDEEISIRYLEQIVIPLKINKLVKSIRGAGGGYILARNPSKIKISEIIQSLEGSFCLVDCIEEKDYCHRTPKCAAHEIWKEASTILRNYFQSISLQDLVEIYEKKNAKSKKKPSPKQAKPKKA